MIGLSIVEKIRHILGINAYIFPGRTFYSIKPLPKLSKKYVLFEPTFFLVLFGIRDCACG